MRLRSLTVLMLALLMAAPFAHADSFTIDKSHSNVGFRIKHLFSRVMGQFNDYEAKISYTPGKPDSWSVKATIQTASIDTDNENRDKHLRSADFFDAEKYPVMTFKSTEIMDATEETAKVKGILDLHGVQKEVVLDLEIHGVGTDPWGNTKAGFSATTSIDRKDFGIIWNESLDNGNLLLGETVDIILEIEADKE